MSDQDEAVLKVRTEGFQEASREAEAFLALLDKMRNAGTANPSASAGAGLPAGAQPGAVDPGNGLTGVGFNQSPVSNLQSFGQFDTPILGGTGLPQNPYYVPPANPGNGLNYNTGGQGGAPPTPTTQVVNAQTVVINSPGGGGVGPAPYAQNFQQARGAPPTPLDNGIGTIPGTPSAAGSGGGFGGAGMPTGENPFPSWNPFRNPSNSYMAWTAGLDIAAGVAKTYYAATQPMYEANLSIQSQQRGGNFVDAFGQRSMTGVAWQQGLYGGIRTGMDVLGGLAGGAVGLFAGSELGPIEAIAGAIAGGAGGTSLANTLADTFLGRDVSTTTANIKADAERDRSYVQFLRSQGLAPDLASTIYGTYSNGSDADLASMDTLLRRVTGPTATLSTREAIAGLGSVSSLGSRVVSGTLYDPLISSLLNSGYSAAGIGAGYDTVASIVNNPAMTFLRNSVTASGNLDNVNISRDILPQLISTNNVQGINALLGAGMISSTQADEAKTQAYTLAGAGVGLSTISSIMSSAQSVIQRGQSTGTSLAVGGMQTVYSAQIYNGMIGDLQQQLIAAPNENARAQIQSQIDSVRAQQASTVTAGTAMGFQATGMQIGLAQAGVSRDVTQAGLFGTPQQQYSASLEQVGIIQQNIQLQQQIIEAAKQGKATWSDMINAQQQIIQLTQQETVVRTESARQFAQLNLAVAGATYGLAQTQAGIGAGIGMSNAQISPLLAASSQDAGQVLTSAQARLANLQKTGGTPSDILSAKQDVANAQSAIINAAMQQVTAGPGSAVQLAQTKAGIDTTIASNTFTPWGNIRGAYEEKLNADIAAGQQDRLNVQRAKATADAAAIKLGYAPGSAQTIDLENTTYNAALQRVGSDVANITADQQQLQTGWMDRLISSTFNMPSRAAYVDTQFTQMEASKYTQGISSVYGTDQIGARNNWMFYGHRLANNLLTNPQTPEGFASTGLNMAAGGVVPSGVAAARSAPSMLSKASGSNEIWVNIVLRDDKGNVKARGRALASTLHDNSNGAITLSGTPYHVATQ